MLPPVLMICLALIAFALRLHHLGFHSLWYDELLELDIAQRPFGEIGPQLIRHAGMPLDYYLLHGWIQLGKQDGWVRFPALLFGVLSVPLIYTLAKRLFNARTGLIAALLLTVSPFAIEYSQEARPYALLLFFTIAAHLGLWQVYQTQQHQYWFLTISALAGATLTHYFAVFLLVPMGLFVGGYLLYHLRQKKYWMHAALFLLSIILLAMIFGLNGRLGYLYSVGERFTREAAQLETYTISASEKPNRGSGPPLTLGFFRDRVLTPLATEKAEALLLYNAFVLVALLTLLFPHQPKRRRAILLLVGWLILPIVLIYAFLLHRGTFYAVRYILYTLPAYLILVAYGIETLTEIAANLGRKLQRRQAPLYPLLRISLSLLLLLPLCLAQFDQLTTSYNSDSREDWRAVAQLLFDNATFADAVIAVNAEPTINWYYPPARTPFGTYNRSEPIWRAIRKHKRRWFVLSSYSFKRDKGLRGWLDQQGAVKIVIDRRVVVYFHREGKDVGEMLAQVKAFSLPQKALTYQVLADQFRQQGDLETSQIFYRKAEQLRTPPAESTEFGALLATFMIGN